MFYKRSQGKKTSPSAGGFLAVQPTPLSRIVLTFRSVISGRCSIQAALLVFSASGFRHFAATKPVSSETHKQHGCQLPTMVLIWNDLSTTSNCFFFLFLTLGRQRGLWSR